MKCLAVIPARFGSTRFPGKPLAMIAGVPMIVRTCRQVAQAIEVHRIIVATDDERIKAVVEEYGFEAMMTGSHHPSGTDRIAEVATLAGNDYDIVVNVQGDEPFIDPAEIDYAVRQLADHTEFDILTLAYKISDPDEIENPNAVKVVFSSVTHKALYFSRSPIPFVRHHQHNLSHYKHVGLYAFRSKTLLKVTTLPPTLLEMAESLEQLRWLEHGYAIGVYETQTVSKGIDTPDDIPYTPINCEFHDRFEDAAVISKPVEITYHDAETGEVTTVEAKIKDLTLQNKQEFMILQSGKKIRLDQIIRFDGYSGAR